MKSDVLLMRVICGSAVVSCKLMCISSLSAAAEPASEAAVRDAASSDSSERKCCDGELEEEEALRSGGKAGCCSLEEMEMASEEEEGGASVEEEFGASGCAAGLFREAVAGVIWSAGVVEGAIMKPGSLPCTTLPSPASLPCQPLHTGFTQSFLKRAVIHPFVSSYSILLLQASFSPSSKLQAPSSMLSIRCLPQGSYICSPECLPA